MAKEQSLPTYDIIRIADCLRTSAEAFENYERLPAKYETYISLRRHDAIDLYTSLRPNHKTLPHIGTLAQQLSWFLSLDGEINEPAVPHTTITEKNLAACFSEIDAIEEYSFNHEYTLYEYYLELAIYYLTKGELQKALSAYQRGKKRNEKPGYGLYTEQSVQREQEFINYCKRLQYKIYSAYAELTSAISLYMAKENKQDVSDQQHLHACYIIGKRYTQHNQHEYAHEFLSLATYTEDKIIQQEALALLAKEPKVQA